MYRELTEKLCNTILAGKIPLEGNWGYPDGVIMKGMEYAYEVNGDERYYNFMKAYIEEHVNGDGVVRQIVRRNSNLDVLNNGKILFSVYKHTGDEKCYKALRIIRERIRTLLRLDGCKGFAHKDVYANQMWLDGLYMLQPLYAQFAAEWGETESFADIAEQFRLIMEFCYNEEKELFYHAYDHTKSMFWANPITGCSPNFWGRAMGWLGMAAVETLDYFPVDHPDRKYILDVIQKLARGICRYQTKEGVWYQVVDMEEREGNYLEASCSCMFAFFLKKCLMSGYLDASYEVVLEKAMKGILREFVSVDEEGWVHVHHVCAVAGLGPAQKPQRDGTFGYYISEPVRDDDGKAVGALLGVFAMYAKEELF